MSQIVFNAVHRAIDVFRPLESRLAKAIATENISSVEKLLQRGANPNATIAGKSDPPLLFSTFEKKHFNLPQSKIDHRSKTLYHVVAKKECLHLLLEHGANPNLRDDRGRTALDIAILWCMPEIVKLLLIYGADPNLRDSKGMTPLMKAAILGIQDARPIDDKLQIIMHLIDAGAEMDARSVDGKTALMYAVGNSRIEVAELLVSCGASLSIEDKMGNRACDIIGRGVTHQQQIDLERVLTQPSLNTLKHKYRKFIPEGDRLLNSILC